MRSLEMVLELLTEAGRVPLSDWPALYPDYRAMGYLCSYGPVEIIHAAGFAPVRLRGSSEPLRQAEAHLQSFTCALCRSTLDRVLRAELGFLEGTVFAHTCDSMQAQADLWRMNTDVRHFLDTVMQPANLASRAGHSYLVAELIRFRDHLAAFVGHPISDSALKASVARYDETRHMVQSLHTCRDRLSASDFFSVLDAAQIMPCEAFNPLLAELLDTLDSLPPGRSGPRLYLVGAVLDEPRLLRLIDGLGGQVVGDDLCSGSRHFLGQVGAGDPIPALADYYLGRPPCATKFHPQHDPGRYLLEHLHQVDAQGVVFVLEKFCEPHAFDYALILPHLNDADVPHLLLEMEQMPSLEALRTRLQAFLETL